MNPLLKKALTQNLLLLCFTAAPLFLAAGTYDAWHIWGFLAVFFAFTFFMTGYLYLKDPKLLERRLDRGKKKEPGKVKTEVIPARIGTFCIVGLFIVSGLDNRFHWSNVPVSLTAAMYAVLIAGYVMFFLVTRENSFASSVIEVEDDQKVITTGPYKFVRHPMYVGSILTYVAIPLVLGSWWGLVFLAPLIWTLLSRTQSEEKFLTENLPEYKEYRAQTRFRLIPFIW